MKKNGWYKRYWYVVGADVDRLPMDAKVGLGLRGDKEYGVKFFELEPVYATSAFMARRFRNKAKAEEVAFWLSMQMPVLIGRLLVMRYLRRKKTEPYLSEMERMV